MILDNCLYQKFKSPCHVYITTHRAPAKCCPLIGRHLEVLHSTKPYFQSIQNKWCWLWNDKSFCAKIYNGLFFHCSKFLMFQVWGKQTIDGEEQLIWGHVLWTFKFYNHINTAEVAAENHGSGNKKSSKLPVTLGWYSNTFSTSVIISVLLDFFFKNPP